MTAGAGKAQELVSAATFMDRPREAKSLDGMAAWTVWGALTGSGEPEELNTVLVTRPPSGCSALRGRRSGRHSSASCLARRERCSSGAPSRRTTTR